MPEPARGEIWLADLSPTRGHEQSGQRPVLIVSDDEFHGGISGLFMAVPFTSKIQNSITNPVHILIAPPEGGLKTPSAILCDQLRTLSRDRLGDKAWGRVTAQTLADVESVLRMLLAL